VPDSIVIVESEIQRFLVVYCRARVVASRGLADKEDLFKVEEAPVFN
jgi:hypothetical protein